MQTVEAIFRTTERVRPVANTEPRLQREVLTSHAAHCPVCGAECRVLPGDQAVLYGSCRHFHSVQRFGHQVTVTFDAPGQSQGQPE